MDKMNYLISIYAEKKHQSITRKTTMSNKHSITRNSLWYLLCSLFKLISKCLWPLHSCVPLLLLSLHLRVIIFRLETLISAHFVPNDFVLVGVLSISDQITWHKPPDDLSFFNIVIYSIYLYIFTRSNNNMKRMRG